MFKITHGYVVQEFDNNGKLIQQDFYAGDLVEYEDEYGQPVEPKDFYAPFDMGQPRTSTV